MAVRAISADMITLVAPGMKLLWLKFFTKSIADNANSNLLGCLMIYSKPVTSQAGKKKVLMYDPFII